MTGLLSKMRPARVRAALPTTLDELFAEAAKYGRLSILMQHDDGQWSATLVVPTTNPAITAELKSGHGHMTPHEAMKALVKNTEAPA